MMKLPNITPEAKTQASGILDIAAGYILSEIFIYAYYYAANKIPALSMLNDQPVPWVNYSMIASTITPLILGIVLKGRMRKMLIYAFWFALASNVHLYLYNSGTVKLP